MKNIGLYFVLLVLAAIIAVYIGIPGTIIISREISIDVNPNALFRQIRSQENWHSWWPKNNSQDTGNRYNRQLEYKELNYEVGKSTLDAVEMKIATPDTIKSQLVIFPISPDSSALNWKCILHNGWNPISRIQNYFLSRKLKNDMGTLLSSIGVFARQKTNVYHLEIFRRKVKDSVMMSTRSIFRDTPTVPNIYLMVDKLKKYIADQNGLEKNYPMLHIEKAGDTGYLVIMAIPVDHSLPETKDIILKRMLYDGKILEAEVKGGAGTIRKGYMDLKSYLEDYHFTAAAIPFELLVTDRRVEPDTSKWITRIYFPVY